MSVAWLVSIAAADPEMPMDTPTSAAASAAASFIPSPTIIVGPNLAFEAADEPDLVLREELGVELLHDAAELALRVRRRRAAVPGQHNRLDAQRSKLPDRLRRAGPAVVGEREDAGELAVADHV
ncbi:hypothetical protein EE612_038056, partial [Oryza sativa]